MRSTLNLRDLSLQVHLGCSAEERARPQEVRVTIDIQMRDLLRACTTDELEDTVCYGTLSDTLHKKIENREFNTIENLAFVFFQEVMERRPKGSAVRLSLHKVNPPVPGLLGGAHFAIESEGWEARS